MTTCSRMLGHLHCPYGNDIAFLHKCPARKIKIELSALIVFWSSVSNTVIIKIPFFWWVSIGVLLWLRKQAAFVIIFIREIHDTLSCRTCNYTIPLDLNHC